LRVLGRRVGRAVPARAPPRAPAAAGFGRGHEVMATATTRGIVRFAIRNFRGIVELEAEPNGKSLTLRGRNSVGKSSGIDALWWGLGGNLEGEVVRNGADSAETEIVIDEYLVRRKVKRGGKPSLSVKSADGRMTYSSPTQLLAGFVAAIERSTFSTLPVSSSKPNELTQVSIIRRLAPGLDCSDLDAQRAQLFEERTGINRDAKNLRAQAEGVVVPADVEVGEERAIADVVD